MPARYNTDAPYLSVVIAARNDNHGGNMLARMQAMIDSWIGQAELYGIVSEIVVVEWNPPPDRPRLRNSLDWPSRPEVCDVRLVEVPHELHARFRNSATIPLHQMIAKNVGIRRSRGEYVLATNLDIIFSAELMRFFGEHRLERRALYRMDRHDVASNLPAYTSIDELLAFCQSHTVRLFAREGDFRLSRHGERMLESRDIVSDAAGTRFGAGWSSVEASQNERYRWVESEAELVFERPSAAAPRLTLTAEVGPSAGRKPVAVEILDEGESKLCSCVIEGRCRLRITMPQVISQGRLFFRVRGSDLPLSSHPRFANLRVFALEWEPPSPAVRPSFAGAPATGRRSEPDAANKWGLEVLDAGPAFDWGSSFSAPSPFAQEIRNAAYLHTNACGDFTLLAREDWLALRAYPEFPIWPMHLDYLFCYAAHHAGMRESILREPMRTYHVEHSSGAGWTPEGEQERIARVAAKGVPEMSHQRVAKWVEFMRRYNAPAIFNLGNWGLGDVQLAEESIWLSSNDL